MDLKINIKVIASTILLISFLEPEFFISSTRIHAVFSLVRFISLIIGFFLIIKLRQVPYVTLIVLLFYFIYGLSTIYGDGCLGGLMIDSFVIICFVFLFEL